MNPQAIWAVTLRYLRILKHDINNILTSLYWPLFDLIIWGFLGIWLQQGQNIPNMISTLLISIVLWQVTSRTASQAIGNWLFEELWTKNLINLFTSPLRVSEWILGLLLYALIFSTTLVFYCSILIWLFYKISLPFLLSSFLYFAPPLFISGIWLGFIGLGIVIYFGRRIQEFIWILSWFFAPFSGVYYPLEILPTWAQKISAVIPMSYSLTGLRNYLLYQKDPWPYLKISYSMSITYAVFAIIFFMFMFSKTKEKGLARLTN